jgi:ankyrin repeat protein
LHPYGLFLTGHVQDDPNLMPYAGYKPSFEEAIGSDNYEAVKSLLEKDNRFSAQDMREALLGNHPRIIRLLWDQGPPYYCAELTYAISQDQPITQIEEVLDKGTSANSREDNSLPLSVAARRGNVACAQLLIQHGVKIGPTNADDYPLDQAVAGKYPEMVDFLLKSGAQITKHTLTMAIRVSLDAGRIPDEGSSQIMKQFIQAGALKGIPAGEAAELLIIACQKQNPIILHQLLDAGLSPLSRCDWPSPGKGPTALDVIREQSVKPAGDGLGPLLHIMEMATKSTGALGRVFKMT